jgi:hypothetical protein
MYMRTVQTSCCSCCLTAPAFRIGEAFLVSVLYACKCELWLRTWEGRLRVFTGVMMPQHVNKRAQPLSQRAYFMLFTSALISTHFPIVGALDAAAACSNRRDATGGPSAAAPAGAPRAPP